MIINPFTSEVFRFNLEIKVIIHIIVDVVLPPVNTEDIEIPIIAVFLKTKTFGNGRPHRSNQGHERCRG